MKGPTAVAVEHCLYSEYYDVLSLMNPGREEKWVAFNLDLLFENKNVHWIAYFSKAMREICFIVVSPTKSFAAYHRITFVIATVGQITSV